MSAFRRWCGKWNRTLETFAFIPPVIKSTGVGKLHLFVTGGAELRMFRDGCRDFGYSFFKLFKSFFEGFKKQVVLPDGRSILPYEGHRGDYGAGKREFSPPIIKRIISPFKNGHPSGPFALVVRLGRELGFPVEPSFLPLNTASWTGQTASIEVM